MLEIPFYEDCTSMYGKIVFKVPMVNPKDRDRQFMYGVVSMDEAIKAKTDTYHFMRNHMLDELCELVVMHYDNGYTEFLEYE